MYMNCQFRDETKQNCSNLSFTIEWIPIYCCDIALYVTGQTMMNVWWQCAKCKTNNTDNGLSESYRCGRFITQVEQQNFWELALESITLSFMGYYYSGTSPYN